MMSSLRRQVGFFGSIGSTELGRLLWPEGVVALVVGGGGAACLVAFDTLHSRIGVVGDGLALVGLLLGIVFAAFSLLIAFFSDDYIRALNLAQGGIVVFMQPYITAIGLQIFAIFVGITYRASATKLPSGVEHVLFGLWLFLFVYVLVDILALARNMAFHGLLRARQVLHEELDENGNPKIRNIESKTSDQG